jgi:hypothetical protein
MCERKYNIWRRIASCSIILACLIIALLDPKDTRTHLRAMLYAVGFLFSCGSLVLTLKK